MSGTGIFQPNALDWFFGSGIGTNLGASLIWVAIAGVAATILWPPLRHWFEWEAEKVHSRLKVIQAHAEHQTRIAEDHFKATTGHAHPHAGRMDHLGDDGRAT
jgi:ABC-type nickel/cobalt efflux system permease component RcnA